jgi:diguanylate cyclase (GGDEF)-like protein
MAGRRDGDPRSLAAYPTGKGWASARRTPLRAELQFDEPSGAAWAALVEGNRGMRTDGSQPPPEEAPALSNGRLSDAIPTLDNGHETLEERVQTLSDCDRFSDDDQAASDLGPPAGIHPASHARTTAIRAETAREQFRVQAAVQRDRAAHERDELAGWRDHDAATCDEQALELDGSLSTRAAHDRRRASRDRDFAARDRDFAARDREFAAHEREQAACDREDAGTDELTGARRRGVGLEELERELDRARRTGESLIAAFVDVDDLKSVNDTHGHHAGDELLRIVADGLRRHMRSYDLVIRLGGDEFLCALPGVTLIDVRRRLNDVRTELCNGPAVRSVSFGLSELGDGQSPQDLIDHADSELLAGRSERRSGRK